jgi:translation initiation factor 3 subunit H
LKIIKHCKENYPEVVTGQLLGLDLASTLEITNCFAFPSKLGDDEEADTEGQEYQIDMMRCLTYLYYFYLFYSYFMFVFILYFILISILFLREVNVDNNTVGWYTSLEMGSLVKEKILMESTVETQFNYQDRIGEKSIVLFYDPVKSFQSVKRTLFIFCLSFIIIICFQFRYCG